VSFVADPPPPDGHFEHRKLRGKLTRILTRKLTRIQTRELLRVLTCLHTHLLRYVLLHPLRPKPLASPVTFEPSSLYSFLNRIQVANLRPNLLPDLYANQPPKLLPVTKCKPAISLPARRLARSRDYDPAIYMYT
jgi:hypothetical protein